MKLTMWQEHKVKWKDCTKCELHKTRNKIVLARGTFPASIAIVGESPGMCLAGDTLIDTAFRDKSIYPKGVPIKDLVGREDLKVYSYDIENDKIEIGTVKKVWQTGVKQVYRVNFWWWGAPKNGKGGREKYYGNIDVTDNHQLLLIHNYYKSIKERLCRGDSLKPFYRTSCAVEHGKRIENPRNVVGLNYLNYELEHRFLLEYKLGRKLEKGEECHHKNENKSDDTYDNLELMSGVEHARYHTSKKNPMDNPVHRETHSKAMKSPEYRKLMSEKMTEIRRAKKWNHMISDIKLIGEQPVYDIEVEKYHNFVANGIFVHNSEDSIGLPFQGPAGYILNQIIERSIPSNLKYAITNLICCVPIDEDEGGKFGKPPEESIIACSDRLEEFIKVCDEGETLKLIITVGTDSRDWFDQKARHSRVKPHITPHRKIPSVFIYHPSWILRKPLAQRSLEVQTAVVTIQNAIEDYITHPKKRGMLIKEEDIGTSKEDKPFNYESEIPF